MSAPQYRIQARSTGEPWRTLSFHESRGVAEAIYEGLAREVQAYGEFRCPRWDYLRLMLGTQLLGEYTPSRDWRKGSASLPREVQA